MKNKVGLIIACLLLGGLVLSAIPALGRPQTSGTSRAIRALSDRVDELEHDVKRNSRALNCFGVQGFGKTETVYGNLARFTNKNPDVWAVTTECD